MLSSSLSIYKALILVLNNLTPYFFLENEKAKPRNKK